MKDIEIVAKVILDVTGLTLNDVYNKNRKHDMERGIFYLILAEEGYTQEQIAGYVHRSRVNVCLVVSHYKGYLHIGDRTVTNLYKRVKEALIKE